MGHDSWGARLQPPGLFVPRPERSFAELGARIFGLSTQSKDDQRETAEQMHLPFPLLSEIDLRLATAMRLPTFEVAGLILLKRLTMILHDGIVERVFYPVFPPDRATGDVLAALRTLPGIA